MDSSKQIYFTVLLALVFSTYLFAQTNTHNQINKSISLEAEFGAGHLITISGTYNISDWGFGVSIGFDTAEYTFLESTFREYLFNFSGLVSYNILTIKRFKLDAYTRVGYELYSLTQYSSHTFFFGPGLKIRYKFLFVDFAFPTLWGLNKPLYVLQLGTGLRYQFDLNQNK